MPFFLDSSINPLSALLCGRAFPVAGAAAFFAGEDGLEVREAMGRSPGVRGSAADAGDQRTLLGRHGGEASH